MLVCAGHDMSHKLQVTLPDDLAAELLTEAERLQVPPAELIRETIRERLQQSRPKSRSKAFEAIDGMIDSPESDLAARVDEVLYR
jgi:metal-responsive CopG/Arc/MetJ family transcriptional regulator